MFIEAEKKQSTHNLTFNLRCRLQRSVVRQWSFSPAVWVPSLPQFTSQIMLTMEEAMKQSGSLPFAAGNIVKGAIIELRPKEVLVDIGYKSEGVIPTNEFIDTNALKVGDKIDVLIEKLENKDGMVELSHEKAEFKKNWERILTICNEGGTIQGKVKSIVKGGLVVDIGVEAFLPASQIDISRRRTSRSSSTTPTNSRSSKSIRSGRTSSCRAAN